MVKRLRVFAGPNGSGKTTFANNFPLSPRLKLGIYVNADDIELKLKRKRKLDFTKYGIRQNSEQVQSYFRNSVFAPVKLNEPELWKYFSVSQNVLSCSKNLKIDSYVAADIAELIRQELMHRGLSFSFETVMSDKRKIDFLKSAKANGFRIYIYFFATEDPLININRVELRVAQKGHPVSADIIKKRYIKSLRNLKEAVKISDRAFLFDNSGRASVLIAEIENGKHVHIIDPGLIPNWFVKYLVNKL